MTDNEKLTTESNMDNIKLKRKEVGTKFLLNLYEIIGKKKIDKLENFKDVHKEDFVNEDASKMLKAMECELFPIFNKKKARYNVIDKVKNYNLNFTKFVCAHIDKELKVKRKLYAVDSKIKSDQTYYIVDEE